MAVTVAQARQETGMRGLRAGGNGRRYGRSENSYQRRPNEMSSTSSFDRHHDFVSTYHIQPAASSRLDDARIVAQLLNFGAQSLIATAQRLYIGMHFEVLLRSKIHLRTSSHSDCHTNSERGEHDNSKHHPRRYYSTATADLGTRSNDIQRNCAHRRQCRSVARRYPLRLNPLVNPISICDPAQEAPPRPLLFLILRKFSLPARSPMGARATMTHP